MSVLETPRIIFNGEVSWDPVTTNNYSDLYNEGSDWTIDENTGSPVSDYEKVQKFRQNASSGDTIIGSGNWNPHGTYRSNFYDTEISGVDMGNGIQKDAIVGGAVNFSGMLVDCEPYGAFSSQLFFNHISFGIDGGCRIFAPRTSRFIARYINFFRLPRKVYNFAASVASVVWQTSFDKNDGLKIDAYDSAALKALATALQNNDVLGLTVQFNAYSTHYYGADNDAEIPQLELNLANKLLGGGFQPNPARSTIIGVVGLWRKGEPAQEPAGRAMLAVKNSPPKFVASAHARVDSNKLTVDLSNSISEIDLQQTKQNLGVLNFFAKDTGGNQTLLGSIDYTKYNRDAYRASAGIITIPLTSAQATAAQNGILQVQDTSNAVYLSEQQYRAVPFDHNYYKDYGTSIGADDGTHVTTRVLVLNKGVPVGKGINVAMFADISNQSTQYYAPAHCLIGCGTAYTPPPPIPVPTIYSTTDDKGIASFTVDISTWQTTDNLNWQNGLVQGFVFLPNQSPKNPPDPSTTIDTQTTNYMFLRVRPAGDNIASLPPTWDNVYNYCLSNWNAMAPCMDNWLDLHNEQQVKAYSSVIQKLTDPNNFESYRFMPITRDMTMGARTLLYNFLNSGGVESIVMTAKPVKSMKKAAKSSEKKLSQAELSRKMRHAK